LIGLARRNRGSGSCISRYRHEHLRAERAGISRRETRSLLIELAQTKPRLRFVASRCRREHSSRRARRDFAHIAPKYRAENADCLVTPRLGSLHLWQPPRTSFRRPGTDCAQSARRSRGEKCRYPYGRSRAETRRRVRFVAFLATVTARRDLAQRNADSFLSDLA
jgi:hypothetical protein